MDELRRFEELFRRLYSPLCQRARRITRDLAVAEDLVQDVFVAFWHDEHRAAILAPEAYLTRAVLNQALNAVSVDQRRAELAADYGRQQARAANPTEQAEQLSELEQQLRRALETLPPVCRKVFLLSRYEDMSHREIADFLGISPNTVDNHIKKALAILRQALLGLLVLLFNR